MQNRKKKYKKPMKKNLMHSEKSIKFGGKRNLKRNAKKSGPNYM